MVLIKSMNYSGRDFSIKYIYPVRRYRDDY